MLNMNQNNKRGCFCCLPQNLLFNETDNHLKPGMLGLGLYFFVCLVGFGFVLDFYKTLSNMKAQKKCQTESNRRDSVKLIFK